MNHKILAPGIVQYDFNLKLTDRLLKSIKESDDNVWEKSKVYGEAAHHNKEPKDVPDNLKLVRTSDVSPLERISESLNKEVTFEVNQSLLSYQMLFNEGENLAVNDEIFIVLRYQVGNYYKMHRDSGPPTYRTVSCLVYLNPNEYDAGETYFKHFDLNVKPDRPSVLFFPSSYSYCHTAKSVESGTKYILTNWYNDLPKISDKENRFMLSNLRNLDERNMKIIDNDIYMKMNQGLTTKKKEELNGKVLNNGK